MVNTLIRQIPSPFWDYNDIPGPPPAVGDSNRQIFWDNGAGAPYIYQRANRNLWALGAAWTGTECLVLVGEESWQFSGMDNVTLLGILVP